MERSEQGIKRQIEVGQTLTFGLSRKMKVVSSVRCSAGNVSQRLTLEGKRGGMATAFVYRNGRIRMQ
jgi:hypothetical protein